jgi:hypothetical protein
MNSSGAISLGGTTAGQSIAIENGGPGTAQISLNDTAVRSLAGVPGSGTTIIMPTNFYGKSNTVNLNLTISSNTYNYDVWANASASPSYVAGKTNVTVTVNPGIVVGDNSSNYAMLVPSSFNPGDTVTIVNSPGAYIVGAGGNGGASGGGIPGLGPYPAAIPGSNGGNAIYVNRPTTITNNGAIGAGGGGGGGGGVATQGIGQTWSGGGGGGGAGYNAGNGGGVGTNNNGAGSPGSPGSTTSGGGGGTGATVPRPAKGGGPFIAGPGGNGGGLGASGTSGGNSNGSPGAGGGGSANYITGNPFVTWPVGPGTVYGGVA